MKKYKKLKPDRNMIGLVPAFASFILSCLVWAILDFPSGLFTLGVIIMFYALMVFVIYIRTKNPYVFFSIAYLIILSMFLLLLSDFLSSHGLTDIKDIRTSFPGYLKALLVIIIIFWVALLIVTSLKKLKWRGREIFELIAEDAELSGSSYTSRPRAIDEIEFTKEDLYGFAALLKRNSIAMNYWGDNSLYICPIKMGDEYGPLFNPNYDYISKTWVSIDSEGSVSVHISRDDYLEYKEDLSFDTLCKSLGELFIEFFNMYQNKESVRIIDKINRVKTFILS